MIEPTASPRLRPSSELELCNCRAHGFRRFEPLVPPSVAIHPCGATVYAPQHLGNMRSQLLPDVLRRVLIDEIDSQPPTGESGG